MNVHGLEKCLEPECRRSGDREERLDEKWHVFTIHPPPPHNPNHTVLRLTFSGEIFELKAELNSDKKEKKKEAVKKVIASMTVGKDVRWA